MIQQNKSDVDSDLIKHYQAVSDEMPAPNINKFSDKKDSPHKHTLSLPVPRQYLANTQQQSSARPGIADTDRPDSGFDPKDDIEEEDGGNKHEDDEDKSPEIKEMSRQALARQPVMKKKRILNK